MSQTNFAALTDRQKIVWSKSLWKQARDEAFVSRFLGKNEFACIQHITELTKTERGDACVMTLVAELTDDGVVGDNEREGNEEEMSQYEVEITIDQISHQVKNKGKMADQRSIINFREQAKDKLAYWLANRIDQLAILTLSGLAYTNNLDGSVRPANSQFPSLKFAQDVTAPSAKRGLMWTGTALQVSNTSAITTSAKASYKMIVDLIAYAKDHYVKPLRAGGKEYYVLLVRPGTLAQLKQDADYQRAVVALAQKDGKNSPWFTGGTVTIDGAVIHESRLVYSNVNAASKWGASSDLVGTRSLLLGAQALAYAEIGSGSWVEKKFQYDNILGISIDKMIGFLKPKFYSNYDKTVEDFSVVAVDHYLG